MGSGRTELQRLQSGPGPDDGGCRQDLSGPWPHEEAASRQRGNDHRRRRRHHHKLLVIMSVIVTSIIVDVAHIVVIINCSSKTIIIIIVIVIRQEMMVNVIRFFTDHVPIRTVKSPLQSSHLYSQVTSTVKSPLQSSHWTAVVIVVTFLIPVVVIITVHDNDCIQRRKSRVIQYLHCASNCLQHVHSSGHCAVVCESRTTHRALITCNMSCATWCEGTAEL